MKLVIGLIVTLICSCLTIVYTSDEEEDDKDDNSIPIHPAFDELHYGVMMMIQVAIFGRCEDQMKTVDMVAADKDYVKFYKCYTDRLNIIAVNNNFGSPDDFDTEAFRKSTDYSKYVCEFYTAFHGCVVDLIPYIAVCLDYESSDTLYKTHTGLKHFLEFACENNSAVFSELWANQRDPCLDEPLTRLKEAFNDIMEVDEKQLFSTSASCRILSMVHQDYQIATARVFATSLTCSESMNTIIRNALSRFWNVSGCNY